MFGAHQSMELASPFMEFALFTSNWDQMHEFWNSLSEVAYLKSLPVHPAIDQHRFDIGGSLLKINHWKQGPLYAPPSGYRELTIASVEETAPRQMTDPDGNHIRLVPPGYDGICQIAMTLGVRNSPDHRQFFRKAMRLPELDEGHFSVGKSVIRLEEDPHAQENSSVEGPGWRYVTLRVADLSLEHAAILEAGGREGRAPAQLRPGVSISMVRDPDGNWIELAENNLDG